MDIQSIETLLKGNSYPGRGIILGVSENKESVVAYFIMGRSENSRNRIFMQSGDGIRTQAYDPQKLEDPSLIIYAPVRVFENATVVTNGDQTDTIVSFLERGKSFEEALRTRTFEPDEPNYTPRISGILKESGYQLSILKSGDGDAGAMRRYFFEYSGTQSGLGHFIHTYKKDGNPLPSFDGEPVKIEIHGEIDKFTKCLWDNLNAENKVSLFVRFIGQNGKHQTRIINKNE